MLPTSYYYGFGNSRYGALSLTAQSPTQSFAEPLSIAEVKTYLNLPERSPVDAEEDDTIWGFISAAREVAEILQGRDLVRKQWDLTLDYFWNWAIELRSPLISVDLVQYRDNLNALTVLAQTTDFLVDLNRQPGIVTPIFNGLWPTYTASPTSSVLIRFTSGYSATDAFWKESGRRIKVGMKLLISEWYNNRLPFERTGEIAEHVGGVRSLLSFGALERAR